MSSAATRSQPEEGSAAPPDGLSALGARILDQLALSSWLPAALLIVGATLIILLRHSQGDLGEALAALEDGWVAALLLALPMLVVTTLVIQAFSFEVIRLLEGYWAGVPLLRWAAPALIRHQVARRSALASARDRWQARAFDSARPAVMARLSPVQFVILERLVLLNSPPDEDSDDLKAAMTERWETDADAGHLFRRDEAHFAFEELPDPHRMLPTRLGNVIRGTEDRLVEPGNDVSGFVQRHREAGSPRLLLQHDQFRTRLDMYCTIVLVCVGLAILAIGLLARVKAEPSQTWWAVALVAASLLLAQGSYRASIASARGYCAVLRELSRRATSKTTAD